MNELSSYDIPFNRPRLVGTELQYIAEAVNSGHISGDGTFSSRCHRFLEQKLGVPRALLTTSCTHALEMAAMLLNLSHSDEVLLPSFTFVSTVNAVVLRGARPVFVDIRPDTLNIDESRLEAAITSRTKALFVVHYAGVGCEMDSISEIAAKHNLAVVEDNAHGLFGKYKGRNLGTFGGLATQSFHETKNVTCGEGGALLINDENFTSRAEIIREKGTDRTKFFRGQVDKYTWVDTGSSYLPSDLLAAFLLAQLEQYESIQRDRKKIWHRYFEGLREWGAKTGVSLPYVPEHCEHSHHMFYLLMPTLDVRSAFIAHLKARRIMAVFHYLPLHLSAMGRTFGYSAGSLPVTENISDRLVRLPMFSGLTDCEQERVLTAITEF